MVVIKGTAIWATDLDIILKRELPPSKSKMSCQIVLLTTKNEHSIVVDGKSSTCNLLVKLCYEPNHT